MTIDDQRTASAQAIMSSMTQDVTALLIICIIVFAVVYAFMEWRYRRRENNISRLISTLRTSINDNNNFSVVDLQLKELSQAKDPDNALLRLVGGASIVALFGYLGLTRLQTIDQELKQQREQIAQQIKDSSTSAQAAVTNAVWQQLTNEFKEQQKDIKGSYELLRQDIPKAVAQAKGNIETIANNASNKVISLESKLNGFSKDYGLLVKSSG